MWRGQMIVTSRPFLISGKKRRWRMYGLILGEASKKAKKSRAEWGTEMDLKRWNWLEGVHALETRLHVFNVSLSAWWWSMM